MVVPPGWVVSAYSSAQSTSSSSGTSQQNLSRKLSSGGGRSGHNSTHKHNTIPAPHPIEPYFVNAFRTFRLRSSGSGPGHTDPSQFGLDQMIAFLLADSAVELREVHDAKRGARRRRAATRSAGGAAAKTGAHKAESILWVLLRASVCDETYSATPLPLPSPATLMSTGATGIDVARVVLRMCRRVVGERVDHGGEEEEVGDTSRTFLCRLAVCGIVAAHLQPFKYMNDSIVVRHLMSFLSCAATAPGGGEIVHTAQCHAAMYYATPQDIPALFMPALGLVPLERPPTNLPLYNVIASRYMQRWVDRLVDQQGCCGPVTSQRSVVSDGFLALDRQASSGLAASLPLSLAALKKRTREEREHLKNERERLRVAGEDVLRLARQRLALTLWMEMGRRT
eukprot:PhM_4_TR7595/c0_g1_i1/m.83469